MRLLPCLLVTCLPFLGMDTSLSMESVERPKIGLALSGGGSKAGAHIGVLRVIDEKCVPIDYIAGTSAGAIIGSLYAAGLNPDEIEAAVAGIDRDDMAWSDSDLVDSGDLRFAGSAFVGTDTPIGPLYLAWGWAEGGNSTAYLYLGNPFIAEGARPLD